MEKSVMVAAEFIEQQIAPYSKVVERKREGHR
jgi:hypothetical protein